MNIDPQERIAISSTARLYSPARALGFGIDYRSLLEFFAGQGRLVRAYYYTALFEDQKDSSLRPLVDWLDYNGYTLVTKPTKEFTDAVGRRRIKGNMDVEIAIDVMETAKKVDRIVLFSGDGDFRRLIEAVQRKAVRISIVSTLRSSPPMVADELRRQADEFIELQDRAPQIARAPSDQELHSASGATRLRRRGYRLILRRRKGRDDESSRPRSDGCFEPVPTETLHRPACPDYLVDAVSDALP